MSKHKEAIKDVKAQKRAAMEEIKNKSHAGLRPLGKGGKGGKNKSNPERKEVSTMLWDKFLASLPESEKARIDKFPAMNRTALYKELEPKLQAAGYDAIKEDKAQCDIMCGNIISSLSDTEKSAIIESKMKKGNKQEHKGDKAKEPKQGKDGKGGKDHHADGKEHGEKHEKNKHVHFNHNLNKNKHFADGHTETTTTTTTIDVKDKKPQREVAGCFKKMLKHPDLSKSDKEEIVKTQQKVEKSSSSKDAAKHVDDLQNHMEKQEKAQPQKKSLYQKMMEFFKKAKEYLMNPSIAKLFHMKKSAAELDKSKSNTREG